jgi:hypothetical protein
MNYLLAFELASVEAHSRHVAWIVENPWLDRKEETDPDFCKKEVQEEGVTFDIRNRHNNAFCGWITVKPDRTKEVRIGEVWRKQPTELVGA